MQIINQLLESTTAPVLVSFLIGVLTSISPCPLATNISAVAYISKKISSTKKTILTGVYYTLGRMSSYTVLSILISIGVSSFSLASIFQKWGDKLLGPILLIIGLTMLDVLKFNLNLKKDRFKEIKEHLSNQGNLGAFVLGALFALAFCPYSGVLFFGMLIPLMATSTLSVALAPIFGFATGLPVIIFSSMLAISVQRFSKAFKITQKIEIYLRKIVAGVFILTGVYYLQFLVKYLLNIFF